jgi:hypothetical protein
MKFGVRADTKEHGNGYGKKEIDNYLFQIFSQLILRRFGHNLKSSFIARITRTSLTNLKHNLPK